MTAKVARGGVNSAVPRSGVVTRWGRVLPEFQVIRESERQYRDHGWPDAAKGMAAVTTIMWVRTVLFTRAETTLRPFGLTFARYNVLMLLFFSRRGALPLSKVGERLLINPASVSNVVSRLEADGLVQRSPNPVDGRGVLAILTKEGRRLAERATEAVNTELYSRIAVPEHLVDEMVELLRSLVTDTDTYPLAVDQA